MNKLISKFETLYESVPFNEIKNEDFLPAIDYLIKKNLEELQLILNLKEKATFLNTVEPFENLGKQLNRVAALFFNLHSVNTNQQINKIAQKFASKLTKYSNDILLNPQLFKRILLVFENKNNENLNFEQIRLINIIYRSFIDNGALLSEENKQKKRKIDQELVQLSLKFSENLLEEINNYYLLVLDKKKLEGLPENYLLVAKKEAKKRNLEGYIFTLHFTSFIPFMKYVKNRKLRKELFLANGRKAFQKNKFNNVENIKKIIKLRFELSNILGFKTFSDWILTNRMAKTPNKVYDFLYNLINSSFPFAKKEIQQIKNLAKKDRIRNLQSYDHAYYSEILKEKYFDFQEKSVRPYFSLEKCLDAVFYLGNKLFNLRFNLRKDIQTYDKEVIVYEVIENYKYKALLYLDFFARKGKRHGAWMTLLKGQYKINNFNHRPHISISCNFTRPLNDVPSLLNFQEFKTLFHEFGHAFHEILANTNYESISGTSVFLDFVELPSQFMENYCYQKEFLKTFAVHYKTGEVIPNNLIDKIIASSNFMIGYQTVQQIGLSILDMNYHTYGIDKNFNIESFENLAIQNYQLYPKITNTSVSCSFIHIFQGMYASGYYSYKWSEVLDADAFEYFLKNGIFNSNLSKKLKILLSMGGTKDPMELYIEFRGREPNLNALFKRSGLCN